MANPQQNPTNPAAQQGAQRVSGAGYTENRPAPRRSTETKSALKTTELIIYVVAVIGVLLASYLVKDTPGGRADYFLADKAWFYIVLLTIGYMISRGLAKSGSRDYYDADQH